MKTIELNVSKAIDSKEFNEYQERVSKIHNAIKTKTVIEKDWLGWIDLPKKFKDEEYKKMQNIAQRWINSNIEVVVVIGIGGSYLGAKAGYEFIYGAYSNKKPKMEILFTGNCVSAESLVSQLQYVENKRFAINVISKSGKTLETSIAFREFRKLLELKVGSIKAKDLIVATTDKSKGILYDLATSKGYDKLIIPDDVGGRFSVLSPVGLFPFICAGLNTEALLLGAQQALKNNSSEEIDKNDAYKYAVTRHFLSKNYSLELLVSYEPKLQFFQEWWKQLFAESEGKNGRGLFPASSQFSTDLHSIGQFIQDGNKVLFETSLFLKNPNTNFKISKDSENLDKISYLDGKEVHKVNWAIFEATLGAHHQTAKIPNIIIEYDKTDEFTLGYLFQFFMIALTMSAYLLGVNPFNQPGVEVYKTNMIKTLSEI
ncbi:glucose-6-phosphate isomerase [Mycoplasma sp. ES3157-GEN-MYC]|uniref:Glucose-6-phosphate isomerase n=1 Tax=Mycoplasma miroungigenitalium TaxID=754515 RepID=A0A6M4JB25_9MOLU|nr:glucose-6-phosphate isomerase [Mycoplasma miroungigenitalium]MBU4690191.1 glucose-6-phosphate isomerase [Mycoplasma miroungigenitalium]MBU4691462.1 glucose-6-phosphate isomerase [Mycoplasma miroungigenitalium]QJR43297.1 glucose-6-phosphate isomerase [Mycoplasma miroungigenitalium]